MQDKWELIKHNHHKDQTCSQVHREVINKALFDLLIIVHWGLDAAVVGCAESQTWILLVFHSARTSLEFWWVGESVYSPLHCLSIYL